MDTRASGFWQCSHHKTPFDVRVFNSFAATNRSSALAATFCRHEGDKHHTYEECIRKVDHGSFTPLVFSSSGGMGTAATTMYKHLAHFFKCKVEFPYPLVMGWLCCCLGLSSVHSSSEVLKRFTIFQDSGSPPCF